MLVGLEQPTGGRMRPRVTRVTSQVDPEMRFVIDHAAKPRMVKGVWDNEWEEALAPLADEPNVACKLSGLVTEAEIKDSGALGDRR